MGRLLEIRYVRGCARKLQIKAGDLIIFSGTGGHIRSGADVVELLGPFLTSTLTDDGQIISPMGTPNKVMFLARSGGRASIDVVTGDPWRTFNTTTLEIIIED
jgi:hypothetical protein